MTRKTKTYGPRQLARHLGMEEWQRDRALREGLIPGPDPSTARWTAQEADDLAARADAVLAAVGTIPDVGARRAEQYLADRLRPGEQVAPGTAAELARRGRLPVRGDYHGPLYCGLTLERGLPRRTVLAASAAGHLHQREALPALMTLRTSDIDHLIRAGLLTPTETTRSSHHRRTVVPLYRWADLQRLLNSRQIDWEQVRATPPGRRSPLADLPDARPTAAR